MQLVVETAGGVSVRTILPAMPRRLQDEQGKAAEHATHGAAALWGLPDFVFEPKVCRRGTGMRELGDGLILCGDLGIVLQVKSRELPSEREERERQWIAKQCKKALAQGNGTIRELERAPATLTNLRGRSVRFDRREVSWLICIIIDHDVPPSDLTVEPPANAIILLRRDWEFLFEQVKSTYGVARYLKRVSGESIPLGDEPIRYYDLAAEDSEAKPQPLSGKFMVSGSRRSSEPLLPLAPVGSEQETEHLLFRGILEDIASIRLEKMPEDRRIRSLAELDRLPTQHRAMAGRFLLDAFERAWAVSRDGATWCQRRFAGFGETQLAFAVCSMGGREMEVAFRSWIELRHYEFAQRISAEQPLTIGVLVTPRSDGERPWDTSMTVAEGPIELTPEQLDAYVGVWRPEVEAAA